MVLGYTSVNTIIANMSIGNSLEISDGDIIEYTAQSLDLIIKRPLLDTSVLFLPVSNNKAKIPAGIIDIDQIAKYKTDLTLNQLLSASTLDGLCSKTIYNEVPVEAKKENFCCYSSCCDKPLEVTKMLPHFELVNLDTHMYQDTNYYKSNFIPMYLSTNTMFVATTCNNKIDVEGYRLEYYIAKGNIVTSFSDGIIAVSAKRHAIDSNGYPLIPDIQEVIQAIQYYIKWKYHESMYDLDGKQMNYKAMLYNKEMYDSFAALAYSNANSINLIAQMENFTNSDKSLIRNDFSYSSMFSDLPFNFK